MTSTETWRLDEALYLQVRGRWIKKARPDRQTIRRVDDWVLDLILDPLHHGEPDPNVPDLYFGRPGMGIGVIYGLNMAQLLIAILEIGAAPGPSR